MSRKSYRKPRVAGYRIWIGAEKARVTFKVTRSDMTSIGSVVSQSVSSAVGTGCQLLVRLSNSPVKLYEDWMLFLYWRSWGERNRDSNIGSRKNRVTLPLSLLRLYYIAASIHEIRTMKAARPGNNKLKLRAYPFSLICNVFEVASLLFERSNRLA